MVSYPLILQSLCALRAGQNWGDVLFSLLPWRQAGSVFDLTGETLAGQGISLLLADLDNTLTSYSQAEPTKALLEWHSDLAAHGVTVFLLSNNRRPQRPERFAKALGIEHISHAGKPKTTGFFQALARCGESPERCAMVGDQVFTDVLGANRAGVRSILVRPISLAGNPGRYLRYWAELPVRWLSRKRQWKG